MPVEYITYKGKEILHVDVSHVKNKQEVLDLLDLPAETYQKSSGNLLVLANLTGTFTDPEVIDRFKHYGKTIFAKKAKKRAVLGISGLKKIILNAYNTLTGNNLKPFDDEIAAKEYLIKG